MPVFVINCVKRAYSRYKDALLYYYYNPANTTEGLYYWRNNNIIIFNLYKYARVCECIFTCVCLRLLILTHLRYEYTMDRCSLTTELRR